MREDFFAFRNKARAALVVETEDANGEIKRMIYGFDPNRELTVSMESDYGMKLTIEGWVGEPSTYSGSMPKAAQHSIE